MPPGTSTRGWSTGKAPSASPALRSRRKGRDGRAAIRAAALAAARFPARRRRSHRLSRRARTRCRAPAAQRGAGPLDHGPAPCARRRDQVHQRPVGRIGRPDRQRANLLPQRAEQHVECGVIGLQPRRKAAPRPVAAGKAGDRAVEIAIGQRDHRIAVAFDNDRPRRAAARRQRCGVPVIAQEMLVMRRAFGSHVDQPGQAIDRHRPGARGQAGELIEAHRLGHRRRTLSSTGLPTRRHQFRRTHCRASSSRAWGKMRISAGSSAPTARVTAPIQPVSVTTAQRATSPRC